MVRAFLMQFAIVCSSNSSLPKRKDLEWALPLCSPSFSRMAAKLWWKTWMETELASILPCRLQSEQRNERERHYSLRNRRRRVGSKGSEAAANIGKLSN